MKFPRCSGILLHFTSLPGRYGIGDLGPCAYEFADFLFAAGQKLWQVLPLNPTGYGDSPYQCFSAFAGNPMLLSLERMRDQGLLQASDLARSPAFPVDHVDYGPVIEFKMAALRGRPRFSLPMLRAPTARPLTAFAKTPVRGSTTTRSSWLAKMHTGEWLGLPGTPRFAGETRMH